MSKTAVLTLQQWGNSLAVRIPAALARSAHFSVGQPVELSLWGGWGQSLSFAFACTIISP
jgi:antitoxin component of MazEF toxin-antitoxin module